MKNISKVSQRAVPAALIAITLATGAYAENANQPARDSGGSGTSNVIVTNTPAQAVPTQDRNNGAYQPFQYNNSGTIMANASETCFTIQIPGGKRLVVEQISAFATVKNSVGTVTRMTAGSQGGGTVAYTWAPMIYVGNQPGSSPAVYGAQKVVMYADPGTNLNLCLTRSTDLNGNYSGTVDFGASLVGHMVDVP